MNKYFLGFLLAGAALLAADPNATPEPKPPAPRASSQPTPSGAVPAPPKAAEKSGKKVAPLLLSDDDEEERSGAGPHADNSRCYVCHLNFAREALSVTHAKANIGCAQCHGPSDAHIADESWASGGNGTAPDKMFPKNKINALCLECHPRKKIDLPQHKAWFDGTGKEAFCTDCHGKHRMTQRKCKWK
jgi:hypothetical protein